MRNAPVLCILLSMLLSSCSDEFNGEDGVKTIYFPESKKIHQTIEYRDGKVNGYLKEYYKSGKLKLQRFLINDTIRDTSIWYHENGNPQTLQIIKNGKREGCWKNYNKSGKAISESNYKDGRLDGPVITYTYKSLRVLKRLNYKNGNKHGKQEYFYNSGRKKSILYFDNDRPCIGTQEWHDSGEQINNDFKIFVQEQNKVLMENKLKFIVRLENPQEDDDVYRIAEADSGKAVKMIMRFQKIKDYYLLELPVYSGGFIMETIKIGVFRKSKLGNTYIKTISFNASVNNF